VSLACGLLLSVALGAGPAAALVRFDFETAYYVHHGRQVWDFSVTRVDSTYHIFYHSIFETTPHASYADTIWHATGRDLAHWDAPVPILFSRTGAWDTTAIWAPDIFRDEANDRWGLAYTGADLAANQRMGMAFSSDLVTWTPAANPVLEPDTLQYAWKPDGAWSDFRDPFVWQEGAQWNLLLTAKQDVGVLYHATSDDLVHWTDVGPFFRNDGPTPARVLESSQHHVIDGVHHLLFGEYNTVGVSHVSAADPADLTMATRTVIDQGYAPELDEFDPGVRIFSRLGVMPSTGPGELSYVVRFDTMLVSPDGLDLAVSKPHPLDAQWQTRTGTSNLGNPVFGDNPLARGEAPVGLVGHGYYGSAEYYQGPLSGRGTPGSQLGPTATGLLESYPFVVEGTRMTLLVGGGDDPKNLYVGLVDTATDSVLVLSTGNGNPHLEPREWDLRPFRGLTCRIRIVDASTDIGGFINVDEIVEVFDAQLAEVPAPAALAGLRAVPNPFNPRTEIRFELPAPCRVEVRVHDLRGRLVWTDGGTDRPAGSAAVAWDGRDRGGRGVAAGAYIYRVLVDGRPAGAGKLSLVR